MKVKRNTLLLIACLVWGAAGVNILRLGVLAYPAYLSVLNFVLSALVFAVDVYKRQPAGWAGLSLPPYDESVRRAELSDDGAGNAAAVLAALRQLV